MYVKSIFVALSALALTACGGADVPMTTNPLPTTPTGLGLGDPANSSPVSVTFLDETGSVVGTFIPSTQMASVSGTQVAAIGGNLNNSFSYMRLLEDATLAYVPATGTTPNGLVQYNGSAVLHVADVPQNAVYEGTAAATFSVRFDAAANDTLTLTGFSGTRQLGVSAPVSVSSGGLTVNGLNVSTSGISGGTNVSNVQFGLADFSGSTFDVEGVFAGPNYAEAGGLIEINAANGHAKITFATTQ